ncbi:MAG: hypothetical protein GX878_02465 [Firmicutes bacterium]|nr:hypothetical protein [Bacillota bacterium]
MFHSTCREGAGRGICFYLKFFNLVVVMLVPVLLLSSCGLLAPKPTNEQIMQAVQASNEAEEEPLDLIFEEMEVPHRYSGRAHAILWVPDHSIQRNYTVVYDRKRKEFYVEDYITLVEREGSFYLEE